MRITANLETCQGYANCVIEAPDVFDIDDSSAKVVVLQATPTPDLVDDVRRAAAACPVKALTIEE